MPHLYLSFEIITGRQESDYWGREFTGIYDISFGKKPHWEAMLWDKLGASMFEIGIWRMFY
jgi:hypothetical protein